MFISSTGVLQYHSSVNERGGQVSYRYHDSVIYELQKHAKVAKVTRYATWIYYTSILDQKLDNLNRRCARPHEMSTNSTVTKQRTDLFEMPQLIIDVSTFYALANWKAIGSVACFVSACSADVFRRFSTSHKILYHGGHPCYDSKRQNSRSWVRQPQPGVTP